MTREKLIIRWSSKSVAWIKSKAKQKFQEYIRLRDEDWPCISCSKWRNKDGSEPQWHGGHFYKAETYSSLVYDEDNCHKQCSHCNNHLSGNLTEYEENLIQKLGNHDFQALKKRADIDKQVDIFGSTPKKLYHIEKYLEYREKIRILKDY